MAGSPLSLTRMVIGLVVEAEARLGTQVKSPFVELIFAWAGAPGSRLNVSRSPLASFAVALNRTPRLGATTQLVIGSSAGATFRLPRTQAMETRLVLLFPAGS